MDLIDHFESLINLFDTFALALDKLCVHIQDDLTNFTMWIDDGNKQFIQDRDKAIYVLKHLSPKEGLSPQETFVCPGVIGANKKL